MFIQKRFYIFLTAIVFCFLIGYASAFFFRLAQAGLLVMSILVAYELLTLFVFYKPSLVARREAPERFSNGDDNEIRIHLANHYPFRVQLELIDEIPPLFQIRDLVFRIQLEKGEKKILKYNLHPVKRGIYSFGHIQVLISTRIGFLARRSRQGEAFQVKVYPSFIYLKQYELKAASSRLTDYGNKRIRRTGFQLEPDQIKEYVKGEDYRFINWKATARRNKLMSNLFQDERDQNLYCLIDKGRTMQSTFNEMTLLDYSINASLALSYVAMLKGDKAGILTFERKRDTFVAASREPLQLQNLQEALYHQTTSFAESDFHNLYLTATQQIKSRSLLLVFTNFDSALSMKRQLKYLSMLAKKHSVLVVFFENKEIAEMAERKPNTKTEVFETVIAQKLQREKEFIIQKLRQHNILSLLTYPNQLTAEVINKYLEIKRQSS